MTCSLTFYDSWKADIGSAAVNGTDTFKLMLTSSSYTANVAHTVKANVTNELSTANGYTQGGIALSNVTWAQTSGTAKFDADDVSVTANADGQLVFRTGVLYDDTVSGDPLVAYLVFDTTPADVTIPANSSGSIVWNASGIYSLT